MGNRDETSTGARTTMTMAALARRRGAAQRLHCCACSPEYGLSRPQVVPAHHNPPVHPISRL
eukprot:scaffold3416_cov133-Isochrysis_galbana.AAC.8